MKRPISLYILAVLLPLIGWAQERQMLSLPNREQLSSERVMEVMQDSEGFLWYATQGGGVCRDDGRQMLVFRSDAEHPDLLGSNDVASLAEAAGRYIIIGTFHGAFVLDKRDYSIRRLPEVDDKKVDDIIVAAGNFTDAAATMSVALSGKYLNITTQPHSFNTNIIGK